MPKNHKSEITKEADEFWKDIIYTDGKLDEKKVLAELYDFYMVMNEVPKVYVAVTGGLLSKPNYKAETVIQQFEECNLDKGITQDDVRDMVKNCDSLEELKKELKDYFNLS